MSKFQSISIEITHGGRSVSDEDMMRAQIAAESVLDTWGVIYHDAFAAYVEQVEAGFSITGLAAIWAEAEAAANNALTEGWHNPDGAFCFIFCGGV